MRHRRLASLSPCLTRQFFGCQVVFNPLLLLSQYTSSKPTSGGPVKDPSLVSSPQEPRQFYRRPLPASCIAFATAEGRQLFKEALEMGFMEAFFDLVPQLRTQVQPSYCGLSAMVMVLNSFEMDPGRVWKAPWRWYHEDMLTCCLSSENLLTHGITIDQFQCIAKCNGLNIDLHQPSTPDETVDAFRSRLLSICSQSLTASGTILVVCYDRKALKQTGSGHFALVGGYHPKRDLLLMLETAAFKYPPHWAPVTAIYTGMRSLDVMSGRPRGYMLITKAFNARTGFPVEEGRHRPAEEFVANSPVLADFSPEVDRLLNRLNLFCLADAAYQAFSSPASLVDPGSAGGRLRLVADEWSAYLSSTLLSSLGKSCCCLLHQQHSAAGPANCSPIPSDPSSQRLSGHRCECPCLVDTLLDRFLGLLIKHRPSGFFFSCQPLWTDGTADASPTLETATQVQLLFDTANFALKVIFELVSSATGRRARLALERLPHRSYEWLTSDSGGPLTYRAITSVQSSGSASCRHPACALPLVTDAKIRATALLTAFVLAFPYHILLSANQIRGPDRVIDVLKSSHHILERLPQLSGQTCFAVLTKGTHNELTVLSNILARLVAAQRPLGSRCIDT
ncbi:unnamed protein product [Mesocestoides corti]|uniref:glutathione gamma-glutamylcysteinyltransferase n=1 Tax=Mesocestoides corti TaxID=53468 RepID=A0A0R3UL56_MESCO|nr:unnamed protein product [Mesocestoides corti]